MGFELWSMSKDILFDNIIITEEITIAEKWAADTFDKKRQKIAKDSVSIVFFFRHTEYFSFIFLIIWVF